MMEGEVSLVAGRSQREKRRSYKDLLREEEIIDAEVRKSSKKRPKESDGFVVSSEFHKKKKKHHDDYHYKDHHKKKKRPSDSHGSSMSASAPSSSPHDGMTAMGLLQAITSPTAVGSEPCPTLPKKPSYPSLPSTKDRRRDSMPTPKPAKKKPHVTREALPMVGEEVELEGHYGGSYELLDDDSSSSAEDEEGGQLVIDDSFNQYRKKSKKSKKSKKKKDKDKEKERRHSSKSNGSSDGGLYAGGRSGSHGDKKKKKEEKARLKAEKAKKKVLTAYQIFSKEYRLSILEEQPGLDFGDLSKKLADAWKQLPEGDKQVWRERAEYLQHKQMKYESTTSKHSKHSQPKPAKDTSKTKGVAQFPGVVTPTPTATQTVAAVQKRPEPAVTLPQNGPSLAPVAEPSPSPLRDPEVDPIDAAAHLQLLGESLSLIGRRLQETEGMVTVSGSLSVLLDSVLCALGPLACLTAQVPELNGCPPHVLSNTLDNIAYVMPGL
ncbi:hypothetical protein PHYPO_G00108350 [Pangasianodon hypophthalmus]|uniref:HMG box domain-containing protein n=1 Tax=Pangasianodon hypophthalmus TaxID=310915 RepID=A0A5N5PZW1_PANHP|nr:hypothetical protein PHYPO_G00108350 [Pangasianodon hypophthalmus]